MMKKMMESMPQPDADTTPEGSDSKPPVPPVSDAPPEAPTPEGSGSKPTLHEGHTHQ
jgi:hypothetical protein